MYYVPPVYSAINAVYVSDNNLPFKTAENAIFSTKSFLMPSAVSNL